jgi:uncharacterized protein
MIEENITIKKEGIGQIKAVLSLPDKNKKHPAVLMLHGFGTNKNEYQNFYQNTAKDLAEQGIASLRFDFRGYGESTFSNSTTLKESEKSSIKTMIEDAELGYQHLNDHCNIDSDSINVLGFSLGAAIAMYLTQKHPEIHSLTLISPALKVADDISHIINKDRWLKTPNDAPKDFNLGWNRLKLSHEFFQTLNSYNETAIEMVNQYKNTVHCIAGETDFSIDNALNIKEVCGQCTIERVKDANHVFMSNGLDLLDKVKQLTCEHLSQNLLNNSKHEHCCCQ